MTIWLAINTAVTLVLALTVYLILRQLGFILARVGPSGARGSATGPRIGENISMLTQREIEGVVDEGKNFLYVFGSDSCSVCGSVRNGVESLLKDWWQDAVILFVYDGDEEADTYPFRNESKGLYFKYDHSMRSKMNVAFVPFAVVTDPQGFVLGKGLVNDVAHLESLLELAMQKKKEAAEAAVLTS